MSAPIRFYPGYSTQKIALWNKPTHEARAADRALIMDRTPENEARVERLLRAIDAHDALVAFYNAVKGCYPEPRNDTMAMIIAKIESSLKGTS